MTDLSFTKQAIVQSFKELCQEKSADKISIVEISQHCGINRQTFYYHFEDKYELLSWIYSTEAFRILADGITLENWGNHLRAFLIHLEKESSFYQNTVTYQPDVFQDYLFDVAQTLFLAIIEKFDQNRNVPNSNRNFYAQFLAYGCCGVVISWIKSGMQESASELANQMQVMVADVEKVAFHLYTQHEEEKE